MKVYKTKFGYQKQLPEAIDIIEIITISERLIAFINEFLGLFTKKVPASIQVNNKRYRLIIDYVEDNLVFIGYYSEKDSYIEVSSSTEKLSRRLLYNKLKEMAIV